MKLDAVLSYGEETFYHTFYVHIYPTKLTKAERWLQDLKAETERLDKEQNKGQDVSSGQCGRAAGHMEICDAFSGCGDPSAWNHTCDVVLCGGRTKEKRRRQGAEKEMEFDYPQLISRFTLYLGSWFTGDKCME